MAGAVFGESEIAQLVKGFAAYLREQRDLFFASSVPLGDDLKGSLAGFFSTSLLQRVRIVELHGKPMPLPPESMRAEAQKRMNLPEVEHMDSFTFVDLVLFRDAAADRRLFHALVHVAQFKVLGVEPYIDFYVKALLKTQNYLTVPLEMQAFQLDARFTEAPARPFKVEEEIRSWFSQGRYSSF